MSDGGLSATREASATTLVRDTDRMPTFDQELLLWLGDEPPSVRVSDAERIHDIAAEFALGFDSLAGIGAAVSIFGSARTPEDHADYGLMRQVAAALGRAGYAVITGGGGGLMEAANRGAQDAGDELFEALTLIQTGTISHFPVILMGDGEWDGLVEWLRTRALANGRIDAADLGGLHFTSDPDEVVQIISAEHEQQLALGRRERTAGSG